MFGICIKHMNFCIYFEGVRKNLHIALIMDFTDPKFMYRCKSNPALYKSCNVLWLDEWNEQTMLEVFNFQ